MAAGIPPTLPNFDELASMGTDYLATVAMEQAGIPAASMVAYGVEELGSKIKEQLNASTAPGQRITVPVILEGHVGMPLPGCTANVDTYGFQLMYQGFDDYDFRLSIAYELPPAEEDARRQNYTEDAIYYFISMGSKIRFTFAPTQSYVK